MLGRIGVYIMIKKAEEAKQPTAQTTLWDIPMDSTKAAITFLKGDPTEVSQDHDEWVYRLPSKSYHKKEESLYVIGFKDFKIRYIGFSSTEYLTSPDMQDIRIGDRCESVIAIFGTPSYISRSEDGRKRILSFDKYNVFFYLQENKVSAYGIYDPRPGPIRFVKEKKRVKKSK